MRMPSDDASEVEILAWALAIIVQQRLDELVQLLAEEEIDAMKVVEVVRRFVEDHERSEDAET